MSTPFEALARELGHNEINAFAVEQGMDKRDPAWAVPASLLPILAAIQVERQKIEVAASQLPEAGIVADAIIDSVAVGVADAVAARVVAAFSARDDAFLATLARARVATFVMLGLAFGVGGAFGWLLHSVAGVAR